MVGRCVGMVGFRSEPRREKLKGILGAEMRARRGATSRHVSNGEATPRSIRTCKTQRSNVLPQH